MTYRAITAMAFMNASNEKKDERSAEKVECREGGLASRRGWSKMGSGYAEMSWARLLWGSSERYTEECAFDVELLKKAPAW